MIVIDTGNGDLIGFQKQNLSYSFLHWNGDLGQHSKFRLNEHSRPLSAYYLKLAPTLLVEWSE
jgi:hypothetical protein